MNGLKTGLIAFVAVTLTVSLLWFTSLSVTPKKVTFEDVIAESRRGGYRVINRETIWEQYRENHKGIFLVDTRQEWEYRTGHIKGAVNFPMEPTWLSRWRKKGAIEKLLGPDKERFIVFY